MKRSGSMAISVGDISEFIFFIQPRINKILQNMTRFSYRRNPDGSHRPCAHPGCTSTNSLIGAHHPRSLKRIIWEVLWKEFRITGTPLIHGNVQAMVDAIIAAHSPVEEAYRFVCEEHAREHYTPENNEPDFPTFEMIAEALTEYNEIVNSGGKIPDHVQEVLDTMATTIPTESPVAPIRAKGVSRQIKVTLSPRDPVVFKAGLLKQHFAVYREWTQSGRSPVRTWNASRFRETSDLMFNIRTGIARPDRCEPLGIIRVDFALDPKDLPDT